jgi:hypothetical protein
MIVYPPTYCVESCDDVLVKGDGKYGYFKAMEPVGGTLDKFAMCIKCHPYCCKSLIEAHVKLNMLIWPTFCCLTLNKSDFKAFFKQNKEGVIINLARYF